MKQTFTFLLSLIVFLTACKKDDIPHKSEFESSRNTWLKTKQSFADNYMYVVTAGSVFGASSETTITVINGKVISRTYKSYVYPQNSTAGTLKDSWTEDSNTLGSHTAGAEALTLDQVYDKAKTVWLKADSKQNDLYFETKNDGIISLCGFVPKGCQDDCFNGITIKSIQRIIVDYIKT